jgi:hypothetical protein
MNDLTATRKLLSQQLSAAVEQDPIGTLPAIVALREDIDSHLREAVRRATATSSWREIAEELGVSKQAAHQRFKAFQKDMAGQIKSEHKAMKRARRRGDSTGAAQAKGRRDELVTDLKTAAKDLKTQLKS